MSKKIIFGEEARRKVLTGITTLSRAVGTTLGPRGRNVALERSWGGPSVVHDGVTVAREVELPDVFEDMGAQMVKQAASRTNDSAGDGTTTSTLLTEALVVEGMKLVSAGMNPMVMKKGIDRAVAKVIDYIKSQAQQIDDEQSVSHIATLSAQNETIGKLISDAFKAVGKTGVITFDEGRSFETTLEIKDGMEIESGYASPYFTTDQTTLVSEKKEPYILITDLSINNFQNDLIPILNVLMKNLKSKDLVIVAESVAQDVIAGIVVNNLQGITNILIVNAPSFGDQRKEIMTDLAVLTGATVVSRELGQTVNSIQPTDFGKAQKVVSRKDKTQFVGGNGNKDIIAERADQIKSLIDASNSPFEKEKLQARLAKLEGGVAVLSIGAPTEVEMKELKERVIDAVSATKAALEEGIVAGGGITLIQARKYLKSMIEDTDDMEEKAGVRLVYDALLYPLKKLCENSGVEYGDILYKITDHRGKSDYGYNFQTLEFTNLLEDGIVDPAKVVRSAIQNAASVASIALTTDVLISTIKEEKTKQ